MYVRGLNTEDWSQHCFSRFAGEELVVAGTTSPILNPMPPVVPKLRYSRGGPGINGFQNAISGLLNQRSTLPSETERVGKSVNGLVAGKGEWGDDESSVRAREERSKES